MKARSSTGGHQQQAPLDDEVLLRLLLRSIIYNAPWAKPDDERLSEGSYSVDDKLDIARSMLPCIDLDTFHETVEALKNEDPIVSLKVLFAEADNFRNLQMAPPDPFYDGSNWRDPEQRVKRIREFYKLAKYRSAYPFKDDSEKKEESWRVWNMVQSGEAMRKPPPVTDIMRDEDFAASPASSARGDGLGDTVATSATDGGGAGGQTDDYDDDGAAGSPSPATTAASSPLRGPAINIAEDSIADGQFIGGNLHSCFGGVFSMRVHALKWVGKPDAKTASALPARATCSFVFQINTKPQWQETQLATFAPRQFITPATVMDFDVGIDTGTQPLQPQQQSQQQTQGGGAASMTPSSSQHQRSLSAQQQSSTEPHHQDELPDIDQIPIRDVRPSDAILPSKKSSASNDETSNNSNDGSAKKKKKDEEYTCYWDFRQEASVLDLKSAPVRVDFCELAFAFRTPPTCCGIFGVDEICTAKIPLSALYVQVLGLNSMNRKRHFRDSYGEDGVHCVHRWFDCETTEGGAAGKAAAQNGKFSVCLSMHLACRAKSHNAPLFHWNPFTDPQFDVHKGQCKILTNVPAMHQMWREPLHRYFIHLIENFSSRLEDIEVSIVENFHDLFCLDPQFLFVWTLRSQLFAGKLNSHEDRATIRRAATCLGQLLMNPAQLCTISSEKFVHDTRKHAIARFLAIPGQLEELFADDDRIIHANDALNLAVTILHTFQIDDIEPSIASAAKRDVAAFFIVGSVAPDDVMTRFAEHCQEVLKDFSLCFQHMKKAVTWGTKVRKIEERVRRSALGRNYENLHPLSPQQQQQQQRHGAVVASASATTPQHQRVTSNGSSGHSSAVVNSPPGSPSIVARLTCSRVIMLRMKVMGEEVCKRLRTAINLVHIVGANSATRARPEAISPLMQLMSSATECADALAQYSEAMGGTSKDKGKDMKNKTSEASSDSATAELAKIAHELEGIVPQTFLPMFLSLARERLHGLVQSIVRSFPLEPSKPGRVHSTPAASDAFQFIRATFDEFCECARSCDVETVLICLGSLLNYLIEAVDVFLNELREWMVELEKDNVVDPVLEKADTAGMCLARFAKTKVTFEHNLTMHATFNSFYRLLVDFWEDDETVDFIHNLQAAVSHLEVDESQNSPTQNPLLLMQQQNKDGAAAAALAMSAAAAAAGGADSEHQLFQAKTSMMEACNAVILPLEITMMDQIFPAALLLPHEYSVWAKENPIKTEDELQHQQDDIAGAAIHCLRQVFRAIVHRADRAVLRDRLCHVAIRSAVTNLINLLVLSGQMMTAQNDMNLRLQRGVVSRIVQATRDEIVAVCDAAGEHVLKANETMLYELDTALAVGLMSSMQLVFTMSDLEQRKNEDNGSNSSSGGGGTKFGNAAASAGSNKGHQRQVSGGHHQLSAPNLKVSQAKYENLLKKALLARAHNGDTACIECATAMSLQDEFVLVKAGEGSSDRKNKKK